MSCDKEGLFSGEAIRPGSGLFSAIDFLCLSLSASIPNMENGDIVLLYLVEDCVLLRYHHDGRAVGKLWPSKGLLIN